MLVSTNVIFSQDNSATLFDIKFDNATFQQAIDELNNVQDIQIYYRESDLPSGRINQDFADSELNSILDKILGGTTLSYFDYRSYAIIIAPRNIVDEYYTSDYYIALQNQNQQTESAINPSSIIKVGDISQLNALGKSKVTGTLTDAISEESVIGATLNFPNLGLANVSDAFGGFEFTLPVGLHELRVSFIGYEELVKMIEVNSDGQLDLLLEPEAITLQEVLVKADAIDVNIENAQIGVERLDVKAIKKLPSFMGEADVVKSLLLQPGVSNVGEGSIGFNVRGGQVDQNLVMQDEGFLFNTSHALGFFSTFNPELISFVTLYKGNIPAEFGGRLASVLDVEMRDGSFRKCNSKEVSGQCLLSLVLKDLSKRRKLPSSLDLEVVIQTGY